jgi:hypothetical protein
MFVFFSSLKIYFMRRKQDRCIDQNKHNVKTITILVHRYSVQSTTIIKQAKARSVMMYSSQALFCKTGLNVISFLFLTFKPTLINE